MKTISCATCRAALTQLLDAGTEVPAGSLPATLAGHMAGCAECTRELAMLRAVRDASQSLGEAVAPAALRMNVRTALQAEAAGKRAPGESTWARWTGARRTWQPAFAWSSGVALAAFALFATTRSPQLTSTVPSQDAAPETTTSGRNAAAQTASGKGASPATQTPISPASKALAAKTPAAKAPDAKALAETHASTLRTPPATKARPSQASVPMEAPPAADFNPAQKPRAEKVVSPPRAPDARRGTTSHHAESNAPQVPRTGGQSGARSQPTPLPGSGATDNSPAPQAALRTKKAGVSGGRDLAAGGNETASAALGAKRPGSPLFAATEPAAKPSLARAPETAPAPLAAPLPVGPSAARAQARIDAQPAPNMNMAATMTMNEAKKDGAPEADTAARPAFVRLALLPRPSIRPAFAVGVGKPSALPDTAPRRMGSLEANGNQPAAESPSTTSIGGVGGGLGGGLGQPAGPDAGPQGPPGRREVPDATAHMESSRQPRIESESPGLRPPIGVFGMRASGREGEVGRRASSWTSRTAPAAKAGSSPAKDESGAGAKAGAAVGKNGTEISPNAAAPARLRRIPVLRDMPVTRSQDGASFGGGPVFDRATASAPAASEMPIMGRLFADGHDKGKPRYYGSLPLPSLAGAPAAVPGVAPLLSSETRSALLVLAPPRTMQNVRVCVVVDGLAFPEARDGILWRGNVSQDSDLVLPLQVRAQHAGTVRARVTLETAGGTILAEGTVELFAAP